MEEKALENIMSLEEEAFKDLLPKEITRDDISVEHLISEAYQELRQLAAAQLRKNPGPATLQVTALVNEACLRLLDYRETDLGSRNQFFFLAARIMRNLLVDHARRKYAAKRGSNAKAVTFEESFNGAVGTDLEYILPLNDLLKRLEKMDQRQCRIVELRYFVGMTYDEIAEIFDISQTKVIREWKSAKRWLFHELGGSKKK